MMPRQFGAMVASPVPRGKRITARIVMLALVAIPVLLVFSSQYVSIDGVRFVMEIAGWLLGISLGLMLILVMVTSSTTLGGRMVGFRFVDTRTGRSSGFVLLVRSLVQSLFEIGTVGLGMLVAWFTYRDGQHWWDRIFNLVAVPADARFSEPPVDSYAPEYAAANPVHLPMPTPGSIPMHSSSAGTQDPPLPQPTPAPAPVSFPVAEQPGVFPAPMAMGPTPRPWPASAASPKELDDDLTTSRAMRAIVVDDWAIEEATVVDTQQGRRGIRSIPEVMLDDGRIIEVDCPILLGRNPLVPEQYPNARCVAVLDSTKRMSKTHLLLIPEPDGLLVVDTGATNGVFVDRNGQRIKLVPNQPWILHPSDAVHFGGRTLELVR